MRDPAPILFPPATSYSGVLTKPERWDLFRPRQGDILVTTPPKCGTTWTQTMIAMLLNGGPDLTGRIGDISPWVDADLGTSGAEVGAALARQTGRRVVKTHTPADGFPVWDGVAVVAVYRHPLDVFLSLRKHAANMNAASDHPMRGPVGAALDGFVARDVKIEDWDADSLATVAHHFIQTVRRDRVPGLILMHYADMFRDGRAAVQHLADALDIEADPGLIDCVAEGSGFQAMKAKAAQFAPEGGKGFWASDAAFFDSGGTDKWAGLLPEAEIARYHARMADLLGPEDKRWLETGGPLP